MRMAIVMLMCWPALGATPAAAKEYRLIYLGGQSNMDGFGTVDQIPEAERTPPADVMIFHGNPAADKTPVDGRGLWAALKLGHGTGFSSDGKKNNYSNRFGCEWTLAKRLRELHPDVSYAFIKYSRGGTSIDARAAGNFGCWEPDFAAGEGPGKGINQYDHCLATLQAALAVKDIDGDGTEDKLIPAGILWMQGESDAAYTEEIARGYEANLKRLMQLLRTALGKENIPVAIGRITDSKRDTPNPTWKFGPIVREAQATYCKTDPAAVLVTSTEAYRYSDPWHYDSAGYLDLGRKFADGLETVKP